MVINTFAMLQVVFFAYKPTGMLRLLVSTNL